MSIANQITRLQGAKQSIKIAIEGKGVTVGDDVKLDGYAALIDSISVGSGEEHVNPDFYNLRTNNGTDCSYLFYQYNGTNLDVSNLDTSSATNMRGIFNNCKSLTTLDLSNFDTSKVTNMNIMFGGCIKLTTLDLSGCDTSKVTDMTNVFNNCQNLTSLDLSNFDTSKVTDMNYMFSFCHNLTSLDLSNFNTSNVTNMSSMFNGCNSLTSLDLSSFDTRNVTSYNSMLYSVPSTCTIYINPETFINSKTGKTFTPRDLNWTGTEFTPKYN